VAAGSQELEELRARVTALEAEVAELRTLVLGHPDA
jgi:cell division protein FtsB